MELFDDTEINHNTKIPKWPFFVADLLLVVTAVFLAYRAEGISDSWYILGCLVAVMLGAVLLIIPFLLDYKTEILDREKSNIDLYSQGRDDLKEAIQELRRTSQSSEKQEQYFSRVEALLNTFLSRIEQPIQAMETNLKGLNSATEQMRNKQDKLFSEAEDIAGKIKEAIQPDELGKTIYDILNQQQAVYTAPFSGGSDDNRITKLDSLEKPIETFEGAQKVDEEKAIAETANLKTENKCEPEDSQDKVIPEYEKSEVKTVSETKSEESPETEPETESEPESEPESEKTEEKESSDPITVTPDAQEVEDDTSEIRHSSKEGDSLLSRAMGHTQIKKNKESGVLKLIKNSNKAEKLKDPFENIDLKDAFNSIDEQDVLDDSEFLEKKQLEELEKKSPTTLPPENAQESIETVEIHNADPSLNTTHTQNLLFDVDEIESENAKPKKAKKGETALIAKVLMGIGNKPYIRGNGAGLTVNKGVEMQSIKPGIWQWKTSETDEMIRCQIYKNDETPSNLGTIELLPGEQQEIEPKF